MYKFLKSITIVVLIIVGCNPDDKSDDSTLGNLLVNVNLSDGTPEPNATVTLIPGNSALLTNTDGVARFSNIPAGNYEVTVELSPNSASYVEGFIYEFSEITVVENNTEILNVEILDPVQPIEETAPDIDLLLANTYSKLKDSFMFNFDGYSMYWGDIGMDLAYIDQNASSIYLALDRYIFEPSNSIINEVWAIHYRAIRDTNLGLEILSEGNYTTESGNEESVISAEFRFLRALFYFNLLKLYGNPVLVTSTSDSVIEQNRPALMSLIEEDLLYAESNLESFTVSTIASVEAAQVLLGRFYLYSAGFPDLKTENYALAASQFDKVLNQFNLEDDYADVFLVQNELNNSEIIFSIDFNASEQNGGGNLGVNWGPLGYAINDFLRLDQKFIGEYFIDEVDFQNPIVFPLNIEDDRFTNNIAPFIVQNGTKSNATDAEDWRPFKFIGDISDSPGVGLSSEDFPYMRYGDVLLMAAEAENAINGPTTKAYDLVNQVIERSHDSQDHLLQGGLSQNEFLLEVLMQRKKELCFEGTYKDDLIRNQLLSDRIQDFNERNPDVAKEFQSHKYIWPIPSEEINLNPNVVQNPGY